MRLGRLGEAWRGTRYHYKLTVEHDFDSIGGEDIGTEPDETSGANQNRFIRGKMPDIKKSKSNRFNAIENHKQYNFVRATRRGIPNG